MNALFADHLWITLALIALAVVLTAYIFYRGRFDDGYEKGEAADPERVRKDNPPDEWAKSHWVK